MKLIPVQDFPRLHVTPLASIQIKNSRVVVELDEETEKRIELLFQPYQAIRVITADCFFLPKGVSIVSQRVVEVVDSEWITTLKANLRLVDETGNFMEKSRHFIIPLQDEFLEIVAWNVVVRAFAAVPKNTLN
jgi:hypothetical protein